uniref:G domain-containing protein n=1 Tax=Panagrolaimus sp. PS1159 TaxID=55785 RepID=A0AC35FLC4_9BILA
MFPSFGYQYSPGDLLSSKTFEKVASVDVETVSDEEVKYHVCYRSIDSSKVLTDLCDMFRCKSGHQMINAVLKDEERFEPLLNFLYSQPQSVLCFGFSVIRKESESCFEVCSAENSQADLMVSKTFSGTFFICVLTAKLPMKDHDSISKKFAFLLEEVPNVSKEHCEYLDNEGIEVTVFANWNEMVCSHMSVGESFAKLVKYDKGCKQRLLSFEVDEIFKCLPGRPLPVDPCFETCYRLMRSIKNKGAEFQQIFDSKKKKSAGSLKYLLSDLQKELKQAYFLKFEHIEQMNGIFVDAMNVLENGLKSFLSTGTVAEPSLYQIMESSLTLILAKYNSGNCIIRDNTVFYNFENMEKLMEYFGKKAFIALRSGTDNFKRWITLEFLQKYPLCCVQRYHPDIHDSLVFYDGDHIYGFGTVILKKSNRRQKSEIENLTFCCVNPEHEFERFWKCTTCNDYVASNGKDIMCKCGINFFDIVEFRCSLSDGKICTKKPVQTARRRNDFNNVIGDSKNSSTFNIVLVGPFGSGRSTLINAALNYTEYSTYENALSRKLIAPIPYKFSILDDHFHEHVVCSKELPENCPENFSSTSGVTQKPKEYELYYNGKNYRFIDTVGYGSNAAKDGIMLNLVFLKSMKHIDAIWFTISGTQNLGVDDTWIRSIVKSIPKLLYSRVYFVFTNIQGKHSLRFNANVAVIAKFFSNIKEFSFGEKNVFTIENNCLKSLYAQRDGCSLTDVQVSIDKTWMESRRVILDLLDKASFSKTSASKSHDEHVCFLYNLFFLCLQLKRLCSEDELVPCSDLLKWFFISSSPANKEKPPNFVKRQTAGLLETIGNYLLSLVK